MSHQGPGVTMVSAPSAAAAAGSTVGPLGQQILLPLVCVLRLRFSLAEMV